MARPRTGGLLLSAQVLAVMLTGCVERFVKIETEPPGADVTVNGECAGKSPVSVPFVHYGTYRVDLSYADVDAGLFARQTDLIDVDAPWYQVPPFDLFSELLSPITYFDEHVHRVTLTPLPPGKSDREGLLRRAAELRRETR